MSADAGLIAGKGALYGARAGLTAGMGGSVICSRDYLFGTGFFMGVSIPVATLTGVLLIIVSVIYVASLPLSGELSEGSYGINFQLV